MVWTPCVRITSMHVRPDAVFEQVADPDELADILAIRDAGAAPALAPGDLALGPGASWIMHPFVRVSRFGSRFTDGSYGVYYAAGDEPTAVAETRYHYARFLAATAEAPQLIGLRVLHADLAAELVDIRGQARRHPDLYAPDPARYGAAQVWARGQRAAGAGGIVYDSVRRPGGECAAVFRPTLLGNGRIHRLLAYEWNGAAIVAVYDVTAAA